MADEIYTDKDQEEIKKIISALDQGSESEIFSPMKSEYQKNIAQFQNKYSVPTPKPESSTENIPQETGTQNDVAAIDDLASLEASDNLSSLAELGEQENLGAGTQEDVAAIDALASPEASDDLSSLAELGEQENLGVETSPQETGTQDDLATIDALASPKASDDLREQEKLGANTQNNESTPEIPDPGMPDPGKDIGDNLPDMGGIPSGGLETPSNVDQANSEMKVVQAEPLKTSTKNSAIGNSAIDEFANMDDDLSDDINSEDIKELGTYSQRMQGIGEEFSDQELANLRAGLEDHPPALRKAIIDSVVNETISSSNQRLLIGMVIEKASQEELADFIEAHVGIKPSLKPNHYTKDGLEIIYADELSEEEINRRRRRNKIVLYTISISFITVVSIFVGLATNQYFKAKNLYKLGLAELEKARYIYSAPQREEHKKRAETFFNKALAVDENYYDHEFLNLYGLAYLRARFYEEAYLKLFGRAEPPYKYLNKRLNAPLIRKVKGANWKKPLGLGTNFIDQSGKRRKVKVAGAYMVDRLRDKKLKRGTLLNLGLFHSNIAKDFTKTTSSKYKNDALAIDYYRLILTLLNKPKDAETLAQIGDVHYNRGELLKAIKQYRKIITNFPLDLRGNERILNAYITLSRKTNDPRLAIDKHRELYNLGLENKIPIHVTTKLAAYYGEMSEDDLKIKYQLDPISSINHRNLENNASRLLELAFNKEETRNGEEILGSRYAEGFYQRGLFLVRKKENKRAMRQFQNAHNYDPMHYLAINEMGEYYKRMYDFEKALEYYLKSIEIYKKFLTYAGRAPEDETLIDGNIGQIYYNAGSLVFLRHRKSTNQSKQDITSSFLYPFRSQKEKLPEVIESQQNFLQAKEYFKQAQSLGIKNKKTETNLQYWSGWIDYMNADFIAAIKQWEAIESLDALDDDNLREEADTIISLAKANAYYYSNQLSNSLGYYLKVKSVLEKKGRLVKTRKNFQANQKRKQLLLLAIYNNIGVVYEMKAQDLLDKEGNDKERHKELEKESLTHYWKAIEISRKAEINNEIARTNVQLAFKKGNNNRKPLLDDKLPFILGWKTSF